MKPTSFENVSLHLLSFSVPLNLTMYMTHRLKWMLTPLIAVFLLIGLPVSLFAQTPLPGDCLGGFTVCALNYNQPQSFQGSGNIQNEINPNTSCLNNGEINNAWYIITVQTPGMFGFNLTPNCDGADYDWALFNLTNASCADIATDPALEVSCNFSGSTFPTAQTGMNNGTNAQDENMVPVVAGQTFALVVNNFTSNTCGYILDLSISSAGIIDVSRPELNAITSQVNCGSNAITFTFTEFVRCNSVSLSDFFLLGPSGDPLPLSGVSSIGCANGGEYDKEFTLLLGNQLFEGGTYTFGVAGAIEDLCGNINSDSQIVFFNIASFEISTSFTPVDCRLNNGTATATITNGGVPPFDYIWAPANQGTATATGLPFGWQEVTVTDSEGCIVRDSVFVEDNSNFAVQVVTIPDTCSFGLGTAFAIVTGGEPFTSPPAPDPYIYFWNVTGQPNDTTFIDSLLTGTYQMSVRDSFGCVYDVEFTVPDYRFNLEADFEFSPDEVPITGLLPVVSFINQSQNASSFMWNFDSGDVSNEFEPDYVFPGSGTFDVKLIAMNSFGCKDSITKPVTIDFVLNYFAPNAFSPNEDLVNDSFMVTVNGIWDSTFVMWVYNRWGEEIFVTNDKKVGWDGKHQSGSKVCEAGVYIYRVFFYDQSGKKHLFVGKVLLVG